MEPGWVDPDRKASSILLWTRLNRRESLRAVRSRSRGMRGSATAASGHRKPTATWPCSGPLERSSRAAVGVGVALRGGEGRSGHEQDRAEYAGETLS